MCFIDQSGAEGARFSLFFPWYQGKSPSRQGTSAAAKQAPDTADDPESREACDRLRLRIINTTFGRLERASSAGSRMLKRSTSPAADLRGRRRPRQQPAEPSELFALALPRDDHVDHAMDAQILGPLEAVGQPLPDGLLDHARAGEADDGPRLGDVHVAEHCV